MPMATESSQPIVASPHDTVDSLVGEVRDGTPIRLGFVQVWHESGKTPGPLSGFVTSADHRALLLYLLMLSRATMKEPWNVALPSAVWARALGIRNPTSKTATSAISKAWSRIENRNLIERDRRKRRALITMLREDGSGQPYSHPKDEGNYFKLSSAFWRSGPDADLRWFEALDLPALAMLLVASTHQPDFALPAENAPEWYGFSADTAVRGGKTLERFDLLDIRKQSKPAPLLAQGYTVENHYTLKPPFSHRRGSAKRATKGRPS